MCTVRACVCLYCACVCVVQVGGDSKEEPSLEDASPALKELIEDFVDTIYDTFDTNRSKALELDEVLNAVKMSTKISDVWEIFGRTLVSRI